MRIAHARAHDVGVVTTQPGAAMPTTPDPQPEPETEEPEGVQRSVKPA